jgi:hypothetical protein
MVTHLRYSSLENIVSQRHRGRIGRRNQDGEVACKVKWDKQQQPEQQQHNNTKLTACRLRERKGDYKAILLECNDILGRGGTGGCPENRRRAAECRRHGSRGGGGAQRRTTHQVEELGQIRAALIAE